MIIIAGVAVAVAQKGNSLSLGHFTKHPIMLVAFVCVLMGIPCSLPIRKNTFFYLNDIIILGWLFAFLPSSNQLQHRVTLPFYTQSSVTPMHGKQSHVFYNYFAHLNSLLFIVYGFEFGHKHAPTLSASTSRMTSAQRKHQVHHTNQDGYIDAGQHNTNCKYEFETRHELNLHIHKANVSSWIGTVMCNEYAVSLGNNQRKYSLIKHS